jgi:hypothetical protein
MKKSDVQTTAKEQTIDEIKPTPEPTGPDTVPADILGLTCSEAHVDSILSEGESV